MKAYLQRQRFWGKCIVHEAETSTVTSDKLAQYHFTRLEGPYQYLSASTLYSW